MELNDLAKVMIMVLNKGTFVYKFLAKNCNKM